MGDYLKKAYDKTDSANKTPVEILRDYCERRWDIQEDWCDWFQTWVKQWFVVAWVFGIALGVSVAIMSHRVDKLQARVDHIEQTWSE